MKKLLVFGLLALSIVACSKSKDDGAAPLSPADFQKASAGSWASNCQTDQQNGTPYVELLTINQDGTGNSVYLIFNQANCQGQVAGQQQVDFTYKITGNDGVETKMDLNIQGQTTPVKVKIAGDIMTVTSANGAVTYKKQ